MFKGFLIALVFRAPLFILFNLWQWAVSGSAVALFIEQIVYFATLYFFYRCSAVLRLALPTFPYAMARCTLGLGCPFYRLCEGSLHATRARPAYVVSPLATRFAYG